MSRLNASGSISDNFIIEFSMESVAFVPFYNHIKKLSCQEVIDFFLLAYHYRFQPVSVRKFTEKSIYEHFITTKGKKQVNLAQKMRTRVDAVYGSALATVFDEALYHCAESLATNYWLDFTKSATFKGLDRKSKKSLFGGFDLKKQMKKEKLPKYIQKPALWFFQRSYDLIAIPTVGQLRLDDGGTFEAFLFHTDPIDISIMITKVLNKDIDLMFVQNLMTVIFDRPMTLGELLANTVTFGLFGTEIPRKRFSTSVTVTESEFSRSQRDAEKSQKGDKSEKSQRGDKSEKSQRDGDTSAREKAVKINSGSKLLEVPERKGERSSSSDFIMTNDPFKLETNKVPQYVFRCFLSKCFEETYKKPLCKLIDELYQPEGAEKKKGKDQSNEALYFTPITNFLNEMIKSFKSKSIELTTLKLFFQIIYNIMYRHCTLEKDKIIHTIAAVLIESICYCIENPIFAGVEVLNGVQIRPTTVIITNMLRNFAYQKSKYSDKGDTELYNQFLGLPILVQFEKWIEGLVTHGRKRQTIVLEMEQTYTVMYDNIFPPNNEQEMDFVIQHFSTRADVVQEFLPEEIKSFLVERLMKLKINPSTTEINFDK